MRVLIADPGWSKGALAAGRALAAAGAVVGVASPERGSAWCSRAASARHRVRSLTSGVLAYADDVAAAVRDGGYDVVLPAGDAELLALSAHRDALDAVLPIPPHDVVLPLMDKSSLAPVVQGSGLSTPQASDWPPPAELGWPVVVKARLHWSPRSSLTRHEATLAECWDQARRAAQQMLADGVEPLVQRYVTGTLHAYAAVLAGADVVAEVHQCATQTWPAGTGISARAVTLPIDEYALALRRSLLAAGWTGLVQVQYLRAGDERWVIDLNPRLYGSLSLAARAGADLATAWAATAIGQGVPRATARPGVRYQWLEGDLQRALAAPSRTRVPDLVATMLNAPGAAHTVLSLRDPGPALRLTARLGARGVHRLAVPRR